jgi:hypothetical protein
VSKVSNKTVPEIVANIFSVTRAKWLLSRKGRFIVWCGNHEKTPLPEPVNELYRPSDRSLSAKLVPISANIRLHAVFSTF